MYSLKLRWQTKAVTALDWLHHLVRYYLCRQPYISSHAKSICKLFHTLRTSNHLIYEKERFTQSIFDGTSNTWHTQRLNGAHGYTFYTFNVLLSLMLWYFRLSCSRLFISNVLQSFIILFPHIVLSKLSLPSHWYRCEVHSIGYTYLYHSWCRGRFPVNSSLRTATLKSRPPYAQHGLPRASE